MPYYDRGQILDGALDGKHLEICWIKNQSDALTIQIEGSARVRLEDGTILRINYDGHNGYPFVPVSRILIERNIIPRKEMSLERIREWMHANPQNAKEVLRQNRSFVFFRIVGLSDDREPKDAQGAAHDREAVGAQGVPLTPGRSIAVDNALHVYGTPFFIQADLPLTGEKRSVSFDRLMIAQDTGSAIVGPARADIFWAPGTEQARSLIMSTIPAISRCWCPVNSTLSQQGRGCPFRQKSHHLLPKPKSAPPLRPRRPPAALDTPWAGALRDPKTCTTADAGVGGCAKQMNVRCSLQRQGLDISVEAFSFSLAPRLSDDGSRI
jgi:3D (Asp-Asp-Asp) domain-containing protein